MPFVQATSNFKLYTIKEHEKSGTHNVSAALWQSGGGVTIVVRTLPAKVPHGIRALFRPVYPLTDREGDAELIAVTSGTITPSYRSTHAGKDRAADDGDDGVSQGVPPPRGLGIVTACDCL